MSTNDAANKAIRAGAGKGRFTTVDDNKSPGNDWLRPELDEAQLRGTPDHPGGIPPVPPVTLTPPVSTGSADGGAGHLPVPEPRTMNDIIRGGAEASHEAHRRDHEA